MNEWLMTVEVVGQKASGDWMPINYIELRHKLFL